MNQRVARPTTPWKVLIMRWLRGGFFGVTYDPIGGGRAGEGRGDFLPTSRIPGTRLRAQRSLSPDAGRGADAEREGISDLRM